MEILGKNINSLPILENGVIGNTRGFEPLILSSSLGSPAKGANMNIYEEKICTNCANNNCTHKIKEVQIDNIITIKCDDFMCKKSRIDW